MSSIDELHWSAILDTQDFDQKAIKLRDDAKKLNKDLSRMLDIYEKFKGKTIITEKGVKNAREMSQILETISKQVDSIPNSVKVINNETEKSNKNLENTSEHYTTHSRLLRQLTQLAGAYFSIRGAERFLKSLIDITGQFEVQKMALTSMLQNAELADNVFNQLRKNALQSPYTFSDLTKFAKQLTAFNIPTESLVTTEKMLADVAAGLGVDMGRIILAYGQVKAAGVLKGTELRQFTEAGVPVLEELAKQIEEAEGKAISLSAVFDRITKKQIPFEMVEEAFKRMTSEGGKFYNMQEVLVETLQGKIGKLKDVWQQALYDLGTSQSALLKGSVDAITRLVSHLDELGRALPEIIAALGAYKLTLIALELANKSFELSNHRVLASLKAVGKWIYSNPYAMLAAAVAAVTMTVIHLHRTLNEGQKRLEEALSNNDKALDEEIQKLDELNAKLKLSERGTKEWKEAKDSIVASYGKYFNGLDTEIEKVGDLSTAYDSLKDSIVEATRVRQYTAFEEQERKILEDTMEGALENIRTRLYKKYTRAEAYTLMNELQTALRNGGTFEQFIGSERVSKIIKEGSYIGDLRQIFASEKAARDQYENNIRTLIKEYGLEGTELDIDFIGPVPVKATNETKKPEQKEWGNDWKPLKVKEDAVSEWDKMMDAIDKETEKSIEEFVKQSEKEFEAMVKSLNEFDTFLERWAYTQADTLGEGVSKRVGDVVSGYKEADYKTLVEYRKQLGNIKNVYDENSTAYENAKQKLDEWKASMDEANKSDFYEKIKSLADDVFKDGLKGFDLTNWSDKTIGQINAIKDALDNLEIPDEIKEALKEYPEGLALLAQEVDDIVKKTEKNTVDPEKLKAIKRESTFAVKKVLGLTDSFAQLGEAVGDSRLVKVANTLKDISSLAGEVIRAFSEFGGGNSLATADAFASYLVFIVEMEKKLLQLAAQDEAQRRREREAQREARNTGRLQDTEAGSFFGTSQTALMNSRIRQLQRIKESMAGYIDDIESMGFRVNGYKLWQKLFGWMHPENYSGGEYLPDTVKSISEIVNKLGLSLYDEYNNLNAESLKAILNSYEDLTDAQREWIQQAISDSEAYAEAIADVNDILNSVFGDIAANAADKIIDRWVEAGDAALDYADILDDVARRYAKMLIESSILDQVLNKEEADKVAAMFINGDVDGAMARIAEDMQAIADMEPLYEKILSAFDPYFNQQSGGDNTLANGIKGITEDTAGLLASYINAIRADVSYIRMLEESGWRDVSGIVAALPTLNDYLAQVAASNANIAESNHQILERIDRLTTTSSGRAALAVDVQ